MNILVIIEAGNNMKQFFFSAIFRQLRNHSLNANFFTSFQLNMNESVRVPSITNQNHSQFRKLPNLTLHPTYLFSHFQFYFCSN
ncbi:Amino acid dehydrogenase family protein [Trifolium repens]|nr:Amino acid dehydrogenase family protein [Trifolium repens]